MTVQVIDITKPLVFKQYSQKYNIFRELYDLSSCAIEIRSCDFEKAKIIHKQFLENKELAYLSENGQKTDMFVLGPFKELLEISKILKSDVNEEVGYQLFTSLSNYVDYPKKNITIDGGNFHYDNVYLAGIVNVTPDSFSDGGNFIKADDAVHQALKLIDDGADIIDVGGESTRPGAEPVSVFEELKRVIPVIEKIKSEKPDTIISIDTTKSEVAKEALNTGASIVNDISGLTLDPKIAEVAADKKATVILMHMQGKPDTMQNNPEYDCVVSDVFDFLSKQTDFAQKEGIKNIIIDPGFGFGKTLEHNFELLNRLNDFKCLGFPVMAGISRKSMLGKSLNLQVDERDNATIIAETIAVNKGASFIRTHNVKNAVQLKTLNNFLNKKRAETHV